MKKVFSKDPINIKEIRKEDVYFPSKGLVKKYQVKEIKIFKTSVTEIKKDGNSENLLIFIHGGAFVSGPAKHHWDSAYEILKATGQTIWLCNYPKAPEHKITEISTNIDAIYSKALETYRANQIILIGDSVGGTLVTALIQRLVKKEIEIPQKIILVSPVMDASMSNPKINEVDAIDPILSKAGILSAKKMCAENNDLKSAMISPLNGSFEKFPTTILFLAENDITYPDQQLAVKKLRKAKIDIEVIEGKKMPHIWPFLPVMKEAKLALKEIIKRLE